MSLNPQSACTLLYELPQMLPYSISFHHFGHYSLQTGFLS
jgi:hypothetical protein